MISIGNSTKGIPPQPAAQYAVNFAEQRIPLDRNIIGDLSHEELKELGVDTLGDRLAIRNAAKVSRINRVNWLRSYFLGNITGYITHAKKHSHGVF